MSAFADAHYLFDTHLLNMIEASAGNGVVRIGNQLVVGEKGAGANMSIDVVSGTCYANATLVVKGATTNVVVTAADGANPRKDLVTMQSDGTVVVTAGTPAAADPGGNTGPETFAPVPPNLPANEILLAEIWVGAAVAQINDADITDRRCYVPSFDDLSVGSSIVHTGDVDNKIEFGADTQDLQTGGSSRMDISDSGVRLGGANTRVTTILDEDAMGSDSDTSLASQQSIKAYVDTEVAAFAKATFANVEIFSGAAPVGWTNLDLSGTIGAFTSLVLLEVGPDAAATMTYRFRQDTETDDVLGGCSVASGLTNGTIGYVILTTTSGGIVEWIASGATTSHVTIKAYIRTE